MDREQKTPTSDSYSEVDEETRYAYKLTTDQLEFLGVIANSQSAAMYNNLNVVPRQRNTDCVRTVAVTPEKQLISQLKVPKRHRSKLAATLKLSKALSKALCAAAIRKSLNLVIPMRIHRRFLDLIEKRPLGNVVMANGSFRHSIAADVALDLEHISADCVQAVIETTKIQPVLQLEIPPEVSPAVVCHPRRKSILSALRRRILKVGRTLCCWCGTVPPEDME